MLKKKKTWIIIGGIFCGFALLSTIIAILNPGLVEEINFDLELSSTMNSINVKTNFTELKENTYKYECKLETSGIISKQTIENWFECNKDYTFNNLTENTKYNVTVRITNNYDINKEITKIISTKKSDEQLQNENNAIIESQNRSEVLNNLDNILKIQFPYGYKISTFELTNDGDGFNVYYGNIKIENEFGNKATYKYSVRVEDETNTIQSIVVNDERIYGN